MSIYGDDNASVNSDKVRYRNRTDSGQYYGNERPVNSFDPSKTTNESPLYRTSVVGASSPDDIVYTKSTTETERYLDDHGISLCKSPNVIQRTEFGASAEYEQCICVRYLQPPALPAPGALTIEEIRRSGPVGPPIIIREQPTIVDAPPPLVLRERPPTPPLIPGPERKTVYISSDAIQERSVIIERYPAIQEKPRDIIIERWLPYGPLPEREVIRKRVDVQGESRGTCTIINYENPHSRVSRKFAISDVYNADPKDYTARYRDSLLDSTELEQQLRRLGVTEDTTSPSSIPTDKRMPKKRLDYLQSRNSSCNCFSAEVNATGSEFESNRKSRYDAYGNSAKASSTTEYRRRYD